jgi:hypothetical protein
MVCGTANSLTMGKIFTQIRDDRGSSQSLDLTIVRLAHPSLGATR